MAYTLQEFLTNAEAGNAIKVIAADPDGYGVPIQNANIGGTEVEFVTGKYYDLGKFHTAKMVLDSYSLRQLIDQGSVLTEAGTITLSREWS